MLPYERAGGRKVVEHTQDKGDWDLIGYRGSDPGDPVICPAGSKHRAVPVERIPSLRL